MGLGLRRGEGDSDGDDGKWFGLVWFGTDRSKKGTAPQCWAGFGQPVQSRTAEQAGIFSRGTDHVHVMSKMWMHLHLHLHLQFLVPAS